MSYVVWEDEMNAVWSVEQQLSTLASMVGGAKELNLSGEGLACLLESLEQQLSEVRDIAQSRKEQGYKKRLSLPSLAQIIRVLSGQEGIRGSDFEKYTNHLRNCAQVDEGMVVVRDAWERARERLLNDPESVPGDSWIHFGGSHAKADQEVSNGC